jgi:hypothetical protein
MALCGEGSPVTFHINYEHRQLLNRLEGLRYVSVQRDGGTVVVPDRLREAQVLELGEEIGRLLGRIPSLNAELARARASEDRGSEFVHVRLVLSGSELAILPFELARAPQAFPGEGLDLCLQGSLPVVVTREIRRSRPRAITWAVSDPRVLFVFAEPVLPVPKTEHILALRQALDPWIEVPDEPAKTGSVDEERSRLPFVKRRLRVLHNASIEDIYRICAEESFTHVHILAHGDTYTEAGEQRFGVALHRRGRPLEKQVIGGKQLAQALRAEGTSGANRSEPLVVTLAMCDSGQQGSVLVPGGSIAHDLHTEGIPWVFASQFPLTVPGSVRIAEFLYPRLMRGDDPRQILYELRRTLSMTASGEHDWASIVTYASVEATLDEEVAEFFAQQTVNAIEVQMSRTDKLVTRMKAAIDRLRDEANEGGAEDADAKRAAREERDRVAAEVEGILDGVKELLQRWEARLPSPDTLADRTKRSNCFGMQGSTYKRIGLLKSALKKESEASHALQEAWQAYRRAMEEWVTDEARFNWTASQYLALSAVLARENPDTGTYAVCRRLAERDLESSDRSIRAWAHGTLAELELLGSFYGYQTEDTKETVAAHCHQIVELMGSGSFHVDSTRRQFQRYAEDWQLETRAHPEWIEVAEAAVNALTPKM